MKREANTLKIREINTAGFMEYGKVYRGGLNKNSPEWETFTMNPMSNRSNEIRSFDCEIYMEPSDGVGVIFLSKNKHSFDMFLMDKPIMLKAGVWFCVLPYQCDFTYALSAESSKAKTEYIDESLTAQGIYPSIHIDRIYTVLYQEHTGNFRFKGERHPYWELTYVDSGSMMCTIEGKDFELRQGDMLMFAPNQFHSQRAANKNPFSFFTVSFDINLSDPNILCGRVISSDNNMHKLIKQILSEYSMDMLYAQEMMVSSLTQLMVTAIRASQDSKRTAQSIPSTITTRIKNNVVSNCIRIIDENIAYKLTLDVLSKRLCVSKSHLSKLFKEEVGIGVSDYIRDRRLEQAKHLIQMGNYTITQVSDMLGYCSVCYFSTEFRKKYKLTPSEYSKSITI